MLSRWCQRSSQRVRLPDCHEHGPIWLRLGQDRIYRRRCRMGTTSRSFADICVACVVAAIVAVSVLSLGVVAWVALL